MPNSVLCMRTVNPLTTNDDYVVIEIRPLYGKMFFQQEITDAEFSTVYEDC